jgi:hypothetical protein
MSNPTIAVLERSIHPTIAEIKDAILTYFPNAIHNLPEHFEVDDHVNRLQVYKTRGGIKEMTIDIGFDGTTIIRVMDRRTANVENMISKPDYRQGLASLRRQWTEDNSFLVPMT